VEGIGAVLDELLDRRPWRSGLALGELARRWDEVVGERLARASTPLSLERGLLVVQAASSAWAAQLEFLASEVRQRANQVMAGGGDDPPDRGRPGPVEKVRIAVDPGPPARR
jgi:predicted nucleic acid-binding Zn ribbon protein